MAVAVLTAALLTAVPVLPQTHGDHTADEVRLSIVQQIRAHRAFVRKVRRREAQEKRFASAPTPSVAPSGPTYQGGWADALRAVGFPDWAIPTMLGYIGRESGGDPSAVNGGGPAVAGGSACGLLQLYPCPGPQALDPLTNLRYAFTKFEASGFAPWGG